MVAPAWLARPVDELTPSLPPIGPAVKRVSADGTLVAVLSGLG
jgi:hypothetical protein